MPIRAITFDLDDTLWAVEPALRRAEQAQNDWLWRHRPRVAEHFTEDSLRERRMAAYRRRPELAHRVSESRHQALYEACLHSGYSETQARQGADGAFAAFLQRRCQVEFHHGAIETLAALAGRYVLGALTNGNADIFRTPAAAHFSFAFTAEQLDAAKPRPDLFHAAMQSAAAAAGEMVHVGDHPEHDVRGAQAVGMRTVWMNSGGWRWPRQRPAADETITAIAQLPAAIARIEQRIQGADAR